jgi:hypothetical protein
MTRNKNMSRTRGRAGDLDVSSKANEDLRSRSTQQPGGLLHSSGCSAHRIRFNFQYRVRVYSALVFVVSGCKIAGEPLWR